ncbi:MAG: hypothetical protein JW991_05165 [Candidatus Pacebacteria bacterium]|nr:hypothetical protein [Candidatus Paceibacterota bacterium]
MAQISKLQLRKEIEQRMYDVFFESLASQKNKDGIEKLLDDLLTPTEKVMLAKRLAIALLLLQNYQYRTIIDFLKVSFSTIHRVSLWLKTEGAGFRETLKTMEKKDRFRKMLEQIADFYTKITPSPYSSPYHRAKKELSKKTPF